MTRVKDQRHASRWDVASKCYVTGNGDDGDGDHALIDDRGSVLFMGVQGNGHQREAAWK
jgi:hypothetical protein